MGSNLLASMGRRRTECGGLGQGFVGCSRYTAFREYTALGWVGEHAGSDYGRGHLSPVSNSMVSALKRR